MFIGNIIKLLIIYSLEEASIFNDADEEDDDCWANCKSVVFKDSQKKSDSQDQEGQGQSQESTGEGDEAAAASSSSLFRW